MSTQGGSPAAPALLIPSQIKPVADLMYSRLDKANAPHHVFNNALINPSFDNWQRGNGPFSAGATATVYGPDRWRVANFGANGSASVSRQALTFGDWPGSQSRFSAVFSCTGHSSVGDGSYASQVIEAVDTFAGKRVVVRGGIRLVSGSVGSKVAIELEQLFGASGSANATTYLGQVALTGVLTPFSVVVDLPSMSGKVIGTSGDCVALNIFMSAGSNFNARTGNLGLQAISIQLADVEVKEIKPGYGDQFPGFERVPKAIDLLNCYRYYERGTFSVLGSGNGAGWYVGSTMPFLATKRISPAMSVISVSTQANASPTSQGPLGVSNFRSYAQTTGATGYCEWSGIYDASAEF